MKYILLFFIRYYSVNVDSYNQIFSESESFKNWRLFVIIFSSICAFIFICLAVFYGYKFKFEYNVPVVSNEKIIPESNEDVPDE